MDPENHLWPLSGSMLVFGSVSSPLRGHSFQVHLPFLVCDRSADRAEAETGDRFMNEA